MWRRSGCCGDAVFLCLCENSPGRPESSQSSVKLLGQLENDVFRTDSLVCTLEGSRGEDSKTLGPFSRAHSPTHLRTPSLPKKQAFRRHTAQSYTILHITSHLHYLPFLANSSSSLTLPPLALYHTSPPHLSSLSAAALGPSTAGRTSR